MVKKSIIGITCTCIISTLIVPLYAFASLLYVGSGTLNSGGLYVFDGETGSFITKSISGITPFDLTFRSDGNLYYVDNVDDGISKADGETGAFIEKVVWLGGNSNPTSFDFGPDGNIYVVTTHGGTTGNRVVDEYDGITGAFISTFIPNGSGGFNGGIITFGPDGNLYVGTGNRVSRYDGTTGLYTGALVEAGAGGLESVGRMLFTNDVLYISDYSNDSVLRYDALTGAFIDEFVYSGSAGLDGPNALTFGPDGNLYVSSALTHSIFRFDGSTGDFIDVFATGSGLGQTTSLVFTPSAVPIPAAVWLFGSGLLGLIGIAKRKKAA